MLNVKAILKKAEIFFKLAESKIVSDSGKEYTILHDDHGISDSQFRFALNKLEDQKLTNGFYLKTFELPGELGSADSLIYGPIVGDAPIEDWECDLVRRGERPNLSRLFKIKHNRPPRKSKLLTIIGSGQTIWTAHGGPAAPREIGDPNAGQDSIDFWAEHALSRG